MNSYPKRLALVIALMITLLAVAAAAAQDMAPVLRNTFFLAADANGVQQVYTLLLDGQSAPRQVSFAQRDVLTYGASYDGLAVAYVSSDQLWLQPIHTETAEALAPVMARQHFSGPVFSPDGQYLAYADDGLWLYDLGARQTRKLLTDVRLESTATTPGDFHIYAPERFVLGADGKAAKLIVDVGVWEWNTVGVYDLATGAWTELEGMLHTGLIPLMGGGALLYGNGGVAGEPALHVAPSLDDLNNSREALRFSDLTSEVLFAEQAVEIHPGVVRVTGPTLYDWDNGPQAFVFDYDLMTGTASPVQFVRLSADPTLNVVAGPLSPDGALLPVYEGALWTDAGGIFGPLRLINLHLPEAAAPTVLPVAGRFGWRP